MVTSPKDTLLSILSAQQLLDCRLLSLVLRAVDIDCLAYMWNDH
jgi:hypothetical protein